MPTYAYRCPGCFRNFEKILPLARYSEPQVCPSCNSPAIKQLSAPAVRGDYEGYACPVTGTWVEGKRAHQENLKRTGCRVYEPGETENQRREKIADEARFDAQVEETVERAFTALPTEKKEALAKEVASGVTASVERN